MKTKIFLSTIILTAIFFFTSCESTLKTDNDLGILPEKFQVDIPNSLTADNFKNAQFKSAEGDTLSGDGIYEMLGFFIAVGEGSASIVEDIIWAIRIHGINQPMEISFVSDDDQRAKNLVVEDNAEFEGKTYDHGLTITDAQSEGNNDGGKAMQVFWNGNPIDGIALIKPFNLDRKTNGTFMETMYRVEYSAVGNGKYDETMLVEISNLPLADASLDRFSLESMKMFVGKKDSVIDVYGNSNHPNAYLFVENEVGFNWAFVASGYEGRDLGVAEVALPPSSLDDDTREGILETYALKQVFTNELNAFFLENWGIRPDSTDLANYLQNAGAPGYFDGNGFVQAGTSPGNQYNVIDARILELVPFKPLDISNLEIAFK